MIVLLLLLLIFPYLTGSLICLLTDTGLTESRIFRYVTGFIADLAIWGIMTLIYQTISPYGAFHVLRYAYIAMIVMLCFIRLGIVLIRHEDIGNGFRSFIVRLKEYTASGSCRIYLLIFLLIAAFQIFSIMYQAPSEYIQDDYYYNTTINDTVYMDQLYTKDRRYGYYPKDPETASPYKIAGYKIYLSPWCAYLALVAATSHIHPLIICHTLIPGFIIVLIYLSLFIIARYFFNGDTGNICPFMMWSSVLSFSFCYTYYLFHLGFQIAAWGKVIAAFTGLPILLLSAKDISDVTVRSNVSKKNILFNTLFLFLMGSGTATMAASIIMVGSAGLFLLMLSCLIQNKKKEVLLYFFSAELPILIQLAIWIFVIRPGS